MQEVIEGAPMPGGGKLECRIGISVGSIVAGIIGKARTFFRVFGDTVNTAARMQSTCKAGQIQITNHVADLAAQLQVPMRCRGEIFVKGKGMMETYLILRIHEQTEDSSADENEKHIKKWMSLTVVSDWINEGIAEQDRVGDEFVEKVHGTIMKKKEKIDEMKAMRHELYPSIFLRVNAGHEDDVCCWNREDKDDNVESRRTSPRSYRAQRSYIDGYFVRSQQPSLRTSLSHPQIPSPLLFANVVKKVMSSAHVVDTLKRSVGEKKEDPRLPNAHDRASARLNRADILLRGTRNRRIIYQKDKEKEPEASTNREGQPKEESADAIASTKRDDQEHEQTVKKGDSKPTLWKSRSATNDASFHRTSVNGIGFPIGKVRSDSLDVSKFESSKNMLESTRAKRLININNAVSKALEDMNRTMEVEASKFSDEAEKTDLQRREKNVLRRRIRMAEKASPIFAAFLFILMPYVMYTHVFSNDEEFWTQIFHGGFVVLVFLGTMLSIVFQNLRLRTALQRTAYEFHLSQNGLFLLLSLSVSMLSVIVSSDTISLALVLIPYSSHAGLDADIGILTVTAGMLVIFTPALVLGTIQCLDINARINTFNFGNRSDPINMASQEVALSELKDDRHAAMLELISGIPLFFMITVCSLMHLADVAVSVTTELRTHKPSAQDDLETNSTITRSLPSLRPSLLA